MREERGQIQGDMVVYEKLTLWGTLGGDCTVVKGGRMYLRGSIYGNLIVEAGGRVHAYGNIRGNVIVHPKAKVILSGTIGGDACNEGGRLYIDSTARIMGRVKNKHDAETKFLPKEPHTRQRDDDDLPRRWYLND